mmetsp:Transcript_37145/g.116916  ORF Transcript_37145/g.116916 Transcript_37145/m.116916 type:complete len:80 (+) Transcript_37145:1778-2017(+)
MVADNKKLKQKVPPPASLAAGGAAWIPSETLGLEISSPSCLPRRFPTRPYPARVHPPPSLPSITVTRGVLRGQQEHCRV